MQRVLGVSLVVFVLLLVGFWPRSEGVEGKARLHAATSSPPFGAASTAGSENAVVAPSTRRRELESDGATSTVATSDARVDLHADGLRAQLEAIARAEQLAAEEARGGAVSGETQRALERALAPVLYAPDLLYRALDMLRSGELEVVAEDGARIDGVSLAEFGAVRAIYWALLAYTAPESDLNQAGAGVPPSELLENVLTALPELRERVQRMLLEQLKEARLDGVPILDASFLTTILYLRAQFPEHRELFSELLATLGESMSAADRDAVFAVLLDENADPTLVGVALTQLLRGDAGGVALRLAESLYDSETDGGQAGARRREAVAKAVAASASDPFDAARFLAERSAETRNMVEAYWTLGEREGGLEAVEAQYFELNSDDLNPRARLALVLAMSRAPAERLLEIADVDSDPSVRGQAFLTLTSADGYAPTQEHVDLLRSRVDGSRAISTGALIGSAANIATHARRSGLNDVAADALELLQSVGGDPQTSSHDRKRITDVLKTQLDASAFELWIARVRELDGS